MNQTPYNGNTRQDQTSAGRSGGAAPCRSAGKNTVAVVLVVALLCAGIGFLATKLLYQKDDKETSKTKEAFLALVDYVDARIGLSDYHSGEMSDKTYYNEKTDRGSASWVKSGAETYPVPNAPLRLEGGVNYIANVTTVVDFTDKGYVISDEAPTVIEAGAHHHFSLTYEGMSISVSAQNENSYSLRLPHCPINKLMLSSGENEVSFEFMNLNQHSTLNDVIASLGKPNGAIGYSAVSIYAVGDYNQLDLCYGYQGALTVKIRFAYHADTDTADFESLAIFF